MSNQGKFEGVGAGVDPRPSVITVDDGSSNDSYLI